MNGNTTTIAQAYAVLVSLFFGIATTDQAAAQAAPEYGVWESVDDDDSHGRFQVMRLKIHPQPAPVPALRHRLIPDPIDRTDGNAAMFYLKAMGFFEQNNARIQLYEMERKWREEAKEQDKDDDYAPDRWYDMPPESLPVEEVKNYLHLISFQEDFLFDAARRKHFSQDRAMEREENPIGYLLPEVQQLRGLARQQIVRCRFAVAEGRIDDAVEIVGQILALANHVGSDEFLVSNLVGVAIETIAVEQGLMLAQQPDTPNLYWAIAACPRPLIDMSDAIAWERQFLARQLPILTELNETVRPSRYWHDFVGRSLPMWNELAAQTNGWSPNHRLPENLDRMQLAMMIATHYPVARKFLSEAAGMSPEQLDQYPITQVVFLAMLKYHKIAMDDQTIRFYLPYSSQLDWAKSADLLRWRSELGWVADATEMFGFAGDQVRAAVGRGKQRLMLWQTVEALRMSAAANNRGLPNTLNDLIVPAPLDPATNRPFEYSLNNQIATITGKEMGGWRYRLIVEVSQSKQEEK